ncbi:MAG: hypothetical protein FWG42_11255, partial [Clostridiales bacterium]|nr:hypothetical protein [Clostridiales bacterium]
MKRKRLLALFTVLCMLIGIFNVNAFASYDEPLDIDAGDVVLIDIPDDFSDEAMAVAAEDDDPVLALRPFPQHNGDNYYYPPAMPSNKTQADMDKMVYDLFLNILNRDLIVATNYPQTVEDFLLAVYHSPGESGSFTVSESHGYGMLFLAYMAGCEEWLNASDYQWRNGSTSIHDYYDAMLRTVQAFPSTVSGWGPNRNMIWCLFGSTSGSSQGITGTGANRSAPFYSRSGERDS